MKNKSDCEQFASKSVTRKTVIVSLAALALSASIVLAACQYCSTVDTAIDVTNINTGQTCTYNCPSAPVCAPSTWRTCDFPDPKTYVSITCTAVFPCSGTATAQFANCKSHWGCGG